MEIHSPLCPLPLKSLILQSKHLKEVPLKQEPQEP